MLFMNRKVYDFCCSWKTLRVTRSCHVRYIVNEEKCDERNTFNTWIPSYLAHSTFSPRKLLRNSTWTNNIPTIINVQSHQINTDNLHKLKVTTMKWTDINVKATVTSMYISNYDFSEVFSLTCINVWWSKATRTITCLMVK